MARAVLLVGGEGEGVGGEGGAGGRDQIVGVGWVGFIVWSRSIRRLLVNDLVENDVDDE